MVPARDEEETIAAVIASLVKQDYAGEFRIILVDDNSSDATAERAGCAPNLRVLRGEPKPAGWAGKMWALRQGVSSGGGAAHPVHRCGHRARPQAPLDAGRTPTGFRSRERNGASQLREPRGARTGAGLCLFLPDALSVHAGERRALGRGCGCRRNGAHHTARCSSASAALKRSRTL